MAEKRRAHRIHVRLRAHYRSPAASLDGWVANLSRFGMFLRSDYLDDEGSTVDVDLDLPGMGEPLHLTGEVVRVEISPSSSGMGIRFGQLPPVIRRRLANFMIERSYQGLQ